MDAGPEYDRETERLLTQTPGCQLVKEILLMFGVTDLDADTLISEHNASVQRELRRCDRAADFRAGADAIEREQAREERAERERFGWLDKETRLQGDAVRAKAAFLRRLAEDVEREKDTSGSTQLPAGESTLGTPASAGDPLVVCQYDVVIEPAPEEEPVLTFGAVAEGGRPVALLFDRESRRRIAGWLAPDLAEGGT
ncbi:hypothetical protein ACFY5K_34890 [Streptomyces griseofuscus]|uniref:hypothetical protein n=1 Tax=Streptomyces griseofuscus TaxID=146922 RepID=UPI003684BBB5